MSQQTAQRLQTLFEQLPSTQQETLLQFAEFLASQHRPTVPQQPVDIPRPEDESVIAAVKRLSRTYPMLDKSQLFGTTSNLMTQHVLQGRHNQQVIDELEATFQQHYQAYCQQFSHQEP